MSTKGQSQIAFYYQGRRSDLQIYLPILYATAPCPGDHFSDFTIDGGLLGRVEFGGIVHEANEDQTPVTFEGQLGQCLKVSDAAGEVFLGRWRSKM